MAGPICHVEHMLSDILVILLCINVYAYKQNPRGISNVGNVSSFLSLFSFPLLMDTVNKLVGCAWSWLKFPRTTRGQFKFSEAASMAISAASGWSLLDIWHEQNVEWCYIPEVVPAFAPCWIEHRLLWCLLEDENKGGFPLVLPSVSSTAAEKGSMRSKEGTRIRIWSVKLILWAQEALSHFVYQPAILHGKFLYLKLKDVSERHFMTILEYVLFKLSALYCQNFRGTFRIHDGSDSI